MTRFRRQQRLVLDDVDTALKAPTDKRIFVIEKAFDRGYTIDRIHELTRIDKWFLHKLKNIHDTDRRLHSLKGLDAIDRDLMLRAKRQGFSDFQIARAVGMEKDCDIEQAILMVRDRRKELGVVPAVKQIDTLAGEFPAQTNYLHLTYNGDAHDIGL